MAGRISKFIDAWKSIFIGHSITAKKLREPRSTIFYPYEKPQLAERFRGAPIVNQYLGETDNKEKTCIACGLCAKACPVNCITVEKEKDKDVRLKVANWRLDLSRCLICGLCTEVCPTGALSMSHDYENAVYEKDQLIYNMERVLRRPVIIPLKATETVSEE